MPRLIEQISLLNITAMTVDAFHSNSREQLTYAMMAFRTSVKKIDKVRITVQFLEKKTS